MQHFFHFSLFLLTGCHALNPNAYEDQTSAGRAYVEKGKEMELKNIKRRTAEGRAVAISRGVKMGRKKTYDTFQIEEIKNMRASQRGYGSIAKSLGMSKSTIARLCREEGI